MATLYVTEYRGLSGQLNEAAQAVHGAPTAEQTVAIAAGVNSSQKLNANTRIVRLHPDAICSVRVSSTGALASVGSARMIAGQTEYFGVLPTDIISVIANV